MVNVYENSTIRDAQGNISGYVPVTAQNPYNPAGYAGNPADAYNAIVAQNQQMQQNAASHAAFIQQPGYVDAASGGYTGRAAVYQQNWQPIQQSRYSQEFANQPARSTVPVRDLSSGMSNPMSGRTVDVYVPEGNYAQQRIPNAKLGLGYDTGEIGIYEQPYGHSIFNLIGGGGRAAAQSGMFSINDPMTPYVIDRGQVGSYAMPSGEGMSRLGAEAYGGFVSPLDGRTLTPGSVMSVYANPNNLANYVNPQGANLGKAVAPGANIPWGIEGSSPAIQYMDAKGMMGVSPNAHINAPINTGNPLVNSQQGYVDSLQRPFTSVGKSGDVNSAQINTSMEAMGYTQETPVTRIESGIIPGGAGLGFGVQADDMGNTQVTIGGREIEGATSPSLIDQLSGTLQQSVRTGLAILSGGMGLAMGSDTIFAMASGKPENLPFYELVSDIVVPYSQPAGTVTKEQYETNLAKYNLESTRYKNDQLSYESSSKAGLDAYNTKLTAFNADKAKYESGGMKDASLFESMTTQFSALQLMQSGLESNTAQFDKLQATYGGLQREQTNLEFQQKNIVNPPTMLDLIGNAYESLNTGLAPYTTDILGIGKGLTKTPDIDTTLYGDTSGLPFSDIINITKGTYIGASQHPLDIVLSYAGGEALLLGERVVAGGVARAAMGTFPVISSVPGVATVGRAFSTPLASDIVTVGKVLVGGYVAYEAGANILAQPTATMKGEALGRTVIQFGGFGAGMIKGDISVLPGETPNRFSSLVSGYNEYIRSTPTNDFTGKGFFSGQQQMGPLERVVYDTRVELLARSQPTPEQATIIRAAGQLGGSAARFNEAPIKAEPNFTEAKALGEDYGNLIKGVAADKSNPTITKGSMVVRSQYPETTIVEAGIREAKDWDALTFDVGKKFETISVESRVGGTGVDVGVVYPTKTVPKGMVSDWSGEPIPENVGLGKVFHHTEYPAKGSWLTPKEHTLFHNIDQGVVAKTPANEAFYNKYLITTPRVTGEGAVPGPKQFANAQEVMASGIADLRPIPDPYPGFKSSIAPDVRPSDAVPLSLIERIMGNPFSKVVGPRGTSEVLISGKTTGYSGATNAEAAQAQFGRKVGSALKDFAEDPIGQGYRGQKDLYDVISINKAQQITAREQGVDITTGDWKKNDDAINSMLDTTLRVGSTKGQKTGGEMINLRDWYNAKEAEVRRGGQPFAEETPYLPDSSPQSLGMVSPAVMATLYNSGGYGGRSAVAALSPQYGGSQSSTRMSPSNSAYGSNSPIPTSSRSPAPSKSPSIFATPPGSLIPSGSPASPSVVPAPPPGSRTPPPTITDIPYPTNIPYPPISSPPSSPFPPSGPSPSTINRPYPSDPPTPPALPLFGMIPGSGGSPRDSRRRRRKVELFSFEIGEDTPIPTRYGLAGRTTNYVPGTRGIAANILPAGDIAPNSMNILNRRFDDRL